MILAALPLLMSFLLKYKYRQISYIFILLVSIGVMQGLCENITFITGADSIQWGPIKALLILVSFILVSLNMANLKRKLPICLLAWSACFMWFCLIIAWHVFEAANAGYTINTFNVMQNYSLLNMLMVYVVFFSYKEQLANTVVDMLIDIGKFVSVVAILQWIVFKYYENNFLVTVASRGFGKLNADDGGGIRVFSVFATHYGLSAFLTIITVLYVARSLHCNRSISYFTLLLLIVAHIFTFNLTGIFLTLIGCIFSYFIHIYSCRMPINYIRKTINIAAFFMVIILCTLISFSDFRKRLFGISDYSETSSGAGNSLYLRHKYISTGFNLLASNLNGVGLTLTDTSKESYEDLGFVRTGITEEFSADAWFLWLIVQVGIFPGLLLLFIYIHPFLIGLLNLKAAGISVRWHICAFTSLLFIIFLGSMSNSAILNYPPSNILIWCAVGVIFAIASRRNFIDEKTL